MASIPAELSNESREHWKLPEDRGYGDELLAKYHESVGGRIVAAAPVAGGGESRPWLQGSHRRWLDGVHIPSEHTIHEVGLFQYQSGVRDTLIEA